jgi:hypothetical protein
MKVLIGTPIHESMDYTINRWLESLAKLSSNDGEVLLVDSSPSSEYIERIRYKLPKEQNITTVHIDVQTQNLDERLAFSHEAIRQKVLDGGFDWYFSWEQNLVIPQHSLDKMLEYSNFSVIHHNHPSVNDPDISGDSLGISLINRSVLQEFGFVLTPNAADSTIPSAYHGVNRWFNRRVFESGRPLVKLYDVLKPIYLIRNN